ncbi:hypothetical protein RCL_jg28114.t1 [Rhizophagus clarus]|uniref:Uncharacterized protein n=1 Tax=Rhizophagus clarus TaxID=94130 RepID=A0A8H3LVD5_9GLOM|nr:hypothetical protein RCL_jg28114.t1 [Rhizophagus clarus]
MFTPKETILLENETKLPSSRHITEINSQAYKNPSPYKKGSLQKKPFCSKMGPNYLQADKIERVKSCYLALAVEVGVNKFFQLQGINLAKHITELILAQHVYAGLYEIRQAFILKN